MTDLSPREKELVEAVRELNRAVSGMAVPSDIHPALVKLRETLSAYDPPKREYAIPSWEEFSYGKSTSVDETSVYWNGKRIIRPDYEAIRNATSKEVKPQ
jgi:hypothetical protein